MELKALLAAMEDLKRLRRLEKAGYFPPGFTNQAILSCIRYLWRIFYLRFKYTWLPYPGPTVTKSGPN